MLIEMKDRGIYPDLILFADTGSEMPKTYETLDAVNSWCERNGLAKIQTVRKTFQGKPESLESNCLPLYWPRFRSPTPFCPRATASSVASRTLRRFALCVTEMP
jgi:uncharacterized protein YqkB